MPECVAAKSDLRIFHHAINHLFQMKNRSEDHLRSG